MISISAQRLLEAWRQCERHLYHLHHALNSLDKLLPVTEQSISNMDDEQIQDWDQFIMRFTKLQDAMGGSLFPALLIYLQEPYETRPMVDKLNRLEQLSFIESAEGWQVLRAIRNRFSYDYPEDDLLKAAYLNEAVGVVPLLRAILVRITSVIEQLKSLSKETI